MTGHTKQVTWRLGPTTKATEASDSQASYIPTQVMSTNNDIRYKIAQQEKALREHQEKEQRYHDERDKEFARQTQSRIQNEIDDLKRKLG